MNVLKEETLRWIDPLVAKPDHARVVMICVGGNSSNGFDRQGIVVGWWHEADKVWVDQMCHSRIPSHIVFAWTEYPKGL